MEEKVEFCDFAEFGEDLEEGVPGRFKQIGRMNKVDIRNSSTVGWRLPT